MAKPKRICLVSVEIFAYGKYGGFGKATRTIGKELARRGYEVFAVVPRRLDQPPEEDLDGITVLSYLPGDVLKSGELYRRISIIPVSLPLAAISPEKMCLPQNTFLPSGIHEMPMTGTLNFNIHRKANGRW